MYKTMPLGRIYMYDSGYRLSKGYCCMQETIPLGRTCMYNSRNHLSKGCCCMCETMPLGRTYMYNSKNHLSTSFTYVILVALASHRTLMGFPIQSNSGQNHAKKTTQCRVLRGSGSANLLDMGFSSY